MLKIHLLRHSMLVLLAAMILALSACTPTLDWRTSAISHHNDRYTITFPGKYLSAQKNVMLGGTAQPLTLHAVQAGDAQFALGQIVASDAVQAQALAQALAVDFAKKLATQGVIVTKQVPVVLASISKPPSNAVLGGFDVMYAASAQQFAQARFVWTAGAAYEMLAVGTPQALSTESADTFVRSIRFE